MAEKLDEILYSNYLTGDQKAFEQLYLKYKNKIQYFVFNIIKDYHKAEDITQDTFIYAMKNNIRDGYTFKYYIYLIARSRALNFINTEQRRFEISEKYFFTEPLIEDVCEIVNKKDEQKEILECLNLLDDKYKNPLYLYNIENFSYKEISEILEIPLNTVKSNIHRGKKILKETLIKKGVIKMNNLKKISMLVLIFCILLTGCVYGTVKLHNYIEYTFELNLNDFEHINGFLYKKIYNYSDFLKYKNAFNSNPEITENDFDENFIILITSERVQLNGLSLKNFYNTENTLQINLINNKEVSKTSATTISVLLNKKMDKENIVIEKVINCMEMKSYTPIKELDKNYSKNKALQDNCLIIDQNEKQTYNKSLLDNFVNSVKNNKNCCLRIYQLINEDILIKDIEYNPIVGFSICYDNTRKSTSQNFTYEYCEINTDNITITNIKSFSPSSTLYSIKDEENEFSFGIYN